LYEVGVKQSLEEARNLFDSLRSPRKKLLGQPLTCRTNVKTVRLFLTWARETQVVDVDALLGQHTVRTGSNKRWMSRLDDGTLLSLSVDIDVVYVPCQVPHDAALRAINQELATIAERTAPLGVQTRLGRSKERGDTKLIVENETSQMKIGGQYRLSRHGAARRAAATQQQDIRSVRRRVQRTPAS
jgi:hypothetical protein